MGKLKRVWNSNGACAIFFAAWMFSVVMAGVVMLVVGQMPTAPIGGAALAWVLGGFLFSIAWINHLDVASQSQQAVKYERRFRVTTQSSAQSPSTRG